LFERFDATLRQSGYIAMSGQIVDARLTAAPRQRNKTQLAIPDRAFHVDKIQAALKLPREYKADYLHELRRQKLQHQ
jgi:hypothetical protein